MTHTTIRIAAGRLRGSIALAALALAACCQPHSATPSPDRPAAPVELAVNEDGWAAFDRPDEGFRLELPAAPTMSSEMNRSIVGEQQIVRYAASADGLSVEAGYLIRNENPLGRLASDDRILDSAVRGTLEHFGARSSAAERITIDGFPGRRVSMARMADGGREEGTLLLVLTPKRIHHLAVFAASGGSEADAASRCILDSFELLGPSSSDE